MRFALLALACFAGPAFAQDAAPERVAKDGVVRLYGAGGPDTAFRRIAEAWTSEGGMEVLVTAGPEAEWTDQAQVDADLLWGTSEQTMTAYLETYAFVTTDLVEPLYLRPAVIAVRAGNPLGIKGFDDLLKAGVRVVVTEGAGLTATSGTGTWEDVAGRLGRLDDVIRLRANIVDYGTGSGASFKAFQDLDADAWITWPNWPLTHPDVLELVSLEPERQIWRDVNVALAPDADPEARAFLDFLTSPEAAAIMATEGWVR